MNVFLIGFMGAGKTTLGKPFAEQLQYRFLDLDDWIEYREGMSVQDIFASKGEQLFRQKEREALKATQFLSGKYLIACGGGTPCYHDNMRLINELGRSIYLQISAAELARRLMPFKSHRPLISHLKDEELEAFIEDMLNKREPFYLQADHIMQSDQASPEDLIALLG